MKEKHIDFQHKLKAYLSVLLWSSASIFSINSQANSSGLDQGLSAALQAMIQYHPEIEGAKNELQVHEYAIDSAKASRYPTISAQANTLDKDVTQGTLRVKQPLWAFGKIDSAIEQTEVNYQTEKFSLLKVQRQLIENTAVAYGRVEGIQKKLKISEENITEHEHLYQRISRRQRGQLSSEADVNLANTRLIQAKTTREKIIGELQVVLTELEAFTQISVDTQQPVNPQLFTDQPIVTASVLASNPNVLYQRERLKVVELDVKQEKISLYPTISFQVEQEFLEVGDNVDRTRAGIVIESTLEGLGFATQGRIKAATARLDVSQRALDSSVNDIQRQINSLKINLNLQSRLVKSQKEAVAAIDNTRASFLRQYESGRKTWMEVLNTHRELNEQRIQLAQIENDWLILSLRLAAMAGRLDSLAGIQTP